jgi:hypothetical protein
MMVDITDKRQIDGGRRQLHGTFRTQKRLDVGDLLLLQIVTHMFQECLDNIDCIDSPFRSNCFGEQGSKQTGSGTDICDGGSRLYAKCLDDPIPMIINLSSLDLESFHPLDDLDIITEIGTIDPWIYTFLKSIPVLGKQISWLSEKKNPAKRYGS